MEAVDFVRALSLRPQDRRPEDVAIVAAWLRRHDVFRRLGEGPLRAVSRTARYERHPGSYLLYRKGQPAQRWYILLSGSVFIDGQMYLPRACYGRRSGVSNRRPNDCLVLEPSEMIVIDYPERSAAGNGGGSGNASRKGVQSMNLDNIRPAEQPSRGQREPCSDLPAPSAMRNLYYPGRQGSVHHRQPPSASQLPFGAGLMDRRSQLSHAQLPHPPPGHAAAPATVLVNGDASHRRPAPYTGASSTTSSRSTETLMEEEGMGTLGRNGHVSVSTERDVHEVVHRSEVYLSGEDQTSSAGVVHRPPLYEGRAAYEARRRGSVRSSTSSEPRTVSSSTGAEDDASGAAEAAGDSEDEDDESCPSGDSFLELRDSVRECLEKEPEERTEEELDVLLDFMAHMPAFASLPLQLKRQLCTRMVFAMVEKAGKTVMKDGEQLDSWCVIVNGEVEVLYEDGSRQELAMGDSFGVKPSTEKQFNRGTMRTLVGDCQFVLVTQEHYVSIMGQLREQLKQVRDDAGETICETERRTLDSREGYVLVKAKPDKLLQHLVEERDAQVDPFYVEDFLLTYRTFLPSPATIFKALLGWFEDPALRDKVARLVLLWVNNHFNDFESSPEMMKLLEEFEACLEKEGLHSQTALLNIACSVKSRSRVVSYTRSDRSDALHFAVIGGAEKRQGIYVAKVEPATQADRAGLKRGDQILSVNNVDFAAIPQQRALEVLRGTTHLSITLKSNLLGFKELLASPSDMPPPPPGGGVPKPGKMSRKGHSTTALAASSLSSNGRPNGSVSLPPKDFPPFASGHHPPHHDPSTKFTAKISRLMDRIRPNAGSLSVTEPDPPILISGVSFSPGHDHQVHPANGAAPINKSFSNPDLNHIHLPQHGIAGGISQYYPASVNGAGPGSRAAPVAAVLKVYRADQSFKYVAVYDETSAGEAVRAALAEFGMDGKPEAFNLVKVSVTPEGVVKQSRLPEQIRGLAEKADLNSRYYLKGAESTAPLVTDDGAAIQKESTAQLLSLNAAVLAAQLTLSDFAIFATVEPTEYVDDLFKLQSPYGCPKLGIFAELVNREMWWVVTEVCRERNLYRRAKLIKKFIKVAKHCRDFRNFNTMFAILSGLDKPAVRRLHGSWDKVPARYNRLLAELQALFAPSRNMSTYRAHLQTVALDPPAIPLYPVFKKDLTFINDGNPSTVDGLVNFEKLRMVGKEVRSVGRLASAPYELSSMFEEGEGGEALIQVNPYDHSVATMRRAPAPKTAVPRKKLYERAHMVRKVKAYLGRLDVVESEQELDRLSLECEAGLSSSSLGNVSAGRASASKRQPSPSPSNLSANSHQHDLRRYTGPKFGVESPSAVQKMLSLVETTRVTSASSVPSAPSSVAAASPASSPLPPRRFLRQQPHGLHPESAALHPHPPDQRISSTGSVTSTDSAVSGGSGRAGNGAMSHAVSCDSTDSGHASIDAAANPNGSPPRQLSKSRLTAQAAGRRPSPSSGLHDARPEGARSSKGRAPPPPSPSVAHRHGPAPPAPRRRSGSRSRPPPPPAPSASASDQQISRV